MKGAIEAVSTIARWKGISHHGRRGTTQLLAQKVCKDIRVDHTWSLCDVADSKILVAGYSNT